MSADASEANRDDGCEWYFGVPFQSKRKAARVKERELKVGDRVRVVKEGWGEDGSYHCADIGDIDVIEKIYGEKIRCAKWVYFRNEIELLPPTFATGTRVRLIRNTQRYAVGDTGTVTLSSDESVGVRMDDGRYWSFKPEDLVVVESEAVAHLTVDASGFITSLPVAPANDHAQPCIVMRLDDGEPRPSYCPHVHPSAASATKEAERLASINPGKQFDVYQRVTGRVAEQHIEMKVA